MSKTRVAMLCGLTVVTLCSLLGSPFHASRAEGPGQTDAVGTNDPRFIGVRSTIQDLIVKDRLPSVAVAVAQHGRIIWEQGFGWADRERLRPATANTMYSLASISKPFTATAVMALVKKGKLQLDAPANDYLGAAKLTGLAGDASGATIRRLLNHTSGLPLHWQFIYSNEAYVCPPMDETILRYGNLINPPGQIYQYSNLGFGVLSYITSHVSGESYGDAMRTLVFAPLGLPHTSVEVPPGLEPYVATRYDSRLRPIPYYTFDHLGASAVYASAHDLIRFAMFHLKDHLSDQEPILDDGTIDLMHHLDTPMGSSNELYGLGFFGTPDEHGLRTVGHDGGMPGVSTTMRLYPDEDLAVVALTNTSPSDVYSGMPVIPRIAEETVSALVPRYAAVRAAKPTAEDPKETYQVRPEVLGTWAGTVRTWQGTIPLKLVFQRDGNIHVKLGDQFETLLNQPHWTGKLFVGLFGGSIPTPDGNRERHHVRLELWERADGKLAGEANAEAADEPPHYSLASYVELARPQE